MTTGPATVEPGATAPGGANEDIALIDLLDRLLAGGVVLAGDITLSVADIDLVYVGLRALISSVPAAERAGAPLPAMIYLYAITEPQAPAPDCLGLEEAPLRLHRAAELGAAYSRHAELECRAEPDALWRHQQVVERLMEQSAVLPARFATTFRDTGALIRALAGAASKLRLQLEAVRGCVELAVRVQAAHRPHRPQDGAPPADSGPPADGRAYLRVQLARRRERELLAERALGPLSRLAVSTRRDERQRQSATIAASFLVRRADVERFADEVRLLQRRHDDLLLSCTGPWAPYSFAGSDAT